MTSRRIDPARIAPSNRLFLDLVSGDPAALGLFERAPEAFQEAAEARGVAARARHDLRDMLRAYLAPLGGSRRSLDNVDAIGEPGTLCVITGQQAGFLGGPAYTAYKILTTVRLARRLERDLGTRVVPVFWLASEDHDFTEINRVQWIGDGGELERVSFDWDGRGRSIEALPITEAVSVAYDEVAGRLLASHPEGAGLFAPDGAADYASWHARIWARWFADEGLVVVEPRAIRPLAAGFLSEACERAGEVRAAIRSGADAVRAAGYVPVLDEAVVGMPFVLGPSGRRTRVPPDGSVALEAGETVSADAALRPILADSLFPTVASVLGPGEIAYHAMLGPLYAAFGVSQPVFVPRHGYTLLSPGEAEIFDRLGIAIDSAVDPSFDPTQALDAAVSPEVRDAFVAARTGLRESLADLRSTVGALDPSLEARWRQAVDRAEREIAKLQERAFRTDLGRRGISTRALRATLSSLHPGGRPQERVLSAAHFVARFGVQWLHQLPGEDALGRFSHYAVTLHEQH